MVKLFSGSAHPKLTQEIAKLINLPISQAEVIRFRNSEVKVTIKENVKQATCVVIQPTSNPTDTNLMELFFFCDALKRQEAKYVVGFIPYFGYARQDIQHRPGECVSANVVIRFLESIGFDKIYTIDLHDEATEGVFSIPFKNLTALPLLADSVKNYLISTDSKRLQPTSAVVVSPDQGGVERARKFGESFFGHFNFSLAVVEKKRNLEKIHASAALALYGNVEGKTAILVDDIVTSGGTLINAANLCLAKGATEVLAAVVHHDFASEAPLKIQNSPIKKFFTTNTIPAKLDQKFPKLEEISIAPLIAKELKNFL